MAELRLEGKIEDTLIFKELLNRSISNTSLFSVVTLIREVGEYAINKTKTVIRHMPEFTLHDEVHISNMLIIVGKILTHDTLKAISNPDIMMIILSIFLHDIGMCPEEKIIRAWKGDIIDTDDAELQQEIINFQRFRESHYQEIKMIDFFNKERLTAKAQYIEEQIISEFIRKDHATRARRIIAKEWEGKIKYFDTDLTSELADICFNHNDIIDNFLNRESLIMCGSDEYLCLPFVAVVLRLADIIDFDKKRAPQILYSHLSIRNPISQKEWEKHLAINAWSITPNSLSFSAQCDHPAVEASIRDFCNQIDTELKNCTYVLAHLNSINTDISFYKIPLPVCVDTSRITAKKNIETGKPKYRYHDTKFTLNKRQVIDLLMGTKLYGKPDVALRELIQNSIDACLLRQKLCESWHEEYLPKIEVKYFRKEDIDFLEVIDNGIGMNQHIIDDYYTNIGQSYYTSKEFSELLHNNHSSYKPISKFGIGILSCFMVSDKLEIKTRRLNGKNQIDDPINITIEGYDSLFIITDGESEMSPGTHTTLELREQHPWQRMLESDFIDSVKDIVPLPPFPIIIATSNIKDQHSPTDFSELGLELKHDYSWEEIENIKIIDICIDKKGLKGKANIAYIASSDGRPVQQIEMGFQRVVADGEDYDLSASIRYENPEICKSSDSLELNEDGTLSKNSGNRSITRSYAHISYHGIDLPCNIFKNYLDYNQKAILHFPFPIRMRIDISGEYELTLNSSRSQIVYDEKWIKFESEFYKIICDGIKNKVDQLLWNQLMEVLLKETDDENLKSIIIGTELMQKH